MKKISSLILILVLASTLMAQGSNYLTRRASGALMISGMGAYSTDLSQDLRSSTWNLNTDVALFLFPQLAGGIDFGYMRDMQEAGDVDDPTIYKDVTMSLGPRVYFFLGGEKSELTPFIKGGANYLINKHLRDDEIIDQDDQELGLVASAGLLLNLAKNVGLSIEAEYNFEKGTAVEDIDTQLLLIKFGIRSFLTD
ncbi:MAG: hypothetical protein K9N35_04285 [Candidatus Marinimicrobia bacterium]|nr:hypothetical protein [Candidatus Neomarinimicrobiota bacterium]